MNPPAKPERPERRHTPLQLLCFHITGITLRLFFKLYGGWKVIGLRENIPVTGPLLLCANHASNIDPPLGWAMFYGHRRMRGVGKVELWRNPVSAYVLNAHDSIPVTRGTADRAMFRAVLEGLSNGDAIGVFPEGTRTPDGNLHPAHAGIGMLIQKSGAPVAPVAFIGTYRMLPRGRKIPRPTRITVVCGKPMVFSPQLSREEIAQQIMQAIAQLMTDNGVPTAPPARACEEEVAECR